MKPAILNALRAALPSAKQILESARTLTKAGASHSALDSVGESLARLILDLHVELAPDPALASVFATRFRARVDAPDDALPGVFWRRVDPVAADLVGWLEGQIGVAAVTDEAAERVGPPETIFLVHGRDDGTKEMVARFLERLTGIEVVILHERPNMGRVLLEKFEAYAVPAAYAVVILEGEDEGRLGDTDVPLTPRGRQNVVFELGFFAGSLGRKQVAVLLGDSVEKPTDLDGLVYIPLAGDWRRELAREIEASGIAINHKALIS
jgi:predicted nucleotide-binding protein